MNRLNQIALVTAITKELNRQIPGLPADGRMNVVIKAANDICDEYSRELVSASAGMGLEAWLNSDDTGSSSLYMAWCLSHSQFGYWQGRKQPEAAYPHDPDDLGRCIRLIEAVPEFGGKIPEMSHRGHQWLAVTTNWERWVELHARGKGRELYNEMKTAYARSGSDE